MCHHNARSGQRMTIVDNCSQAACPVRRLTELKQEYDTALTLRDAYIGENNEKLSAAKFLKNLAEKMEPEDSDVWEAFRKPNNDDRATSYSDTRLKTDIETIERNIRQNRNSAEEKARTLIDYFKSRSVQTHLTTYHNQSLNNVISIELVINNTLKDLAKSENGIEFLSSLWTQNTLSALDAVETVFGFMENASSLSNEMCEFIKHISPVLMDEVINTISRNNFRNVAAVLNNSHIQSKLRFLSQKTGINFQALSRFLTSNAEATSRKFNHLVQNSEDLGALRNSLSRADVDLERAELGEELEKFDGIGAVLKVLAFTLATYKIASDFKAASAKDRIAFVSTVLNFGKDVGELAVRGESRVNMILGFYGATFGLIVNLIDAVENFEGKEPLLGVLNMIGATAAFVGIFAQIVVGSAEVMGLSAATVAAATAISSACIVVGIIILVLIYIFTDPPFIAFIEDTYYGVDHRIRLTDTIDKFFELPVFEMSLFLEGDDPDKRLVIESRALDDAYPIYLKLNKNGRSLGTKLIDPTSENYHGKANIQKYAFWNYDRRRTRQLTINRFWEIWDDEERGVNVRTQNANYALYAQLDPDRDGTMEISAQIDPLNFPSIQALIRTLTFDNNYIVYLRGGYLKYTNNGQVNITIGTTEAIGYTCQILWSKDDGGTWSRQSSRINSDTNNFSITISPPPQNNTYTLTVVAKLFDNVNPEPVNTYRMSDVQVGTEAYLRSEGIS